MAYGHSFVILAAAWAHRAEIDGAAGLLAETWHYMETHFFEPAHMAYADERDAGGTTLSPYRGQNANMHTVEALIAAFEATGEARYLDRGDDVARQFTCLLYTSPSPRDYAASRMPSSA